VWGRGALIVGGVVPKTQGALGGVKISLKPRLFRDIETVLDDPISAEHWNVQRMRYIHRRYIHRIVVLGDSPVRYKKYSPHSKQQQ